ncbi:tRNA(His) guanylyltransferase Thg1 family protein [Methanobrevibacter sp. DSM 116169]|uniref:tRNA(His) guanylyltransferase Thg1 family protein n=1 Tax=Methanobrevibacter sp. DSM 116169 TaxID=3242727 RepID=UPI0038FCC9E9
MKEYEIYSSFKVPMCSKTILRLDGRSFHSLSSSLNFEKPYDENFSKSMVDACIEFFKEFSPKFIFTFSDEINILFNKLPFSGRIEKVDSVFPSFISSSLTLNLNKTYNLNSAKPIAFDSRVITITDLEIFKYFKWRQDESWRNCVNSYGIWALKEKYGNKEAQDKINGLKLNEIHELLFDMGINLNNLPIWQKRGIAIYKNNLENLFVDTEIPKFTNEFFKNINIINV